MVLTLAVGCSWVAPSLAAARSCPDELPKTAAARRALAKEWFTEGEAAQARADQVEAVKAYACSFRIVPHAFTAYNLAKAAEKTGDLQQALGSYRNYLTLAPDAPERPQVEQRIEELEGRIAQLEQPVDVRPRQAPAPAAEPQQPGAPATLEDRPAAPEPPRSHRVAGAALLGSGVVALAGGIALNVLGRQKMSDCRDLWYREMQMASNLACDDARPLAYGSYGLLGLSGAALGAAAALFLWDRRAAAASVAVTPAAGGGALSLRGTF